MLNPIIVLSRAAFAPPTPASLSRTTLGRLASYGGTTIANVRDAFDAADWTAEGSTPSVFLASGNLTVAVLSTAGGRAYAKLTALSVQADAYTQATMVGQSRAGSAPSLLSRYQSTSEFLEFGASGANQNIIRERVAGADVQSLLRTPITFYNRYQMRTQGTDITGMPFTTGSSLPLSGIGLSTAGYLALGCWNNNGINTNGSVTYGEFYATRNSKVKVSSSLADGWYVVLLDASSNILAQSDEAVAGEVTIDAYDFKLTLPLVATLEVREYATGNVLISDTPVETVWPGDEWTFTPASGYTPPGVVTRLVRSIAGKLSSFARWADIATFYPSTVEAFASANWTGFAVTGTSTPGVNANGEFTVALNSGGTSPRGARYNATSFSEDHFILTTRLTQTTGGSFGVAGRIDPASPTQNQIFCTMPLGFSGTYSINERLANVLIQNVTGFSSNRTTTSETSHGLWIRDDLADSRQISAGGTGTADAALDLTSLDAASNYQYAGVYFSSSSANTATIRAWSAMRSAILRITGPNTGTWQVRLRNAAGTIIYTSASHTGGVVEINTLDEMTVLYASGLPLMTQIEIYDPGTATVLRGPETPPSRLWGGDEWTWNT